jgi:D-glucosaminate-6-phosphate ammonia-lyase
MTLTTPAKNVYARIGVRRVINGYGTWTFLGGSLMPPEVLRAMHEAAGSFVILPELQEKVGERIAGLIGVPAALVTSGAAGAITAATAACLTRGDAKALSRLPDTSGLRDEVVIQKSHESGYEAQIRLTGAKLIWVGTRAELEHAVGDRTAMTFYLNFREPGREVTREEWLRVGRERGVPTFLDAAADVPPAGRLSEYVREGFDLVAFSGGKGLRGPQSTGLLLGRADLVAAARKAVSPSNGIGRGMKVGKEGMIGLLAAVERYLSLDHDAERRALETRAHELLAALAGVPGLDARIDVPPVANHVPHVVLEWDARPGRPTAGQLCERLLRGDPPIAVPSEGERALRVSVWTMHGDEHRIVARRVVEELEGVAER